MPLPLLWKGALKNNQAHLKVKSSAGQSLSVALAASSPHILVSKTEIDWSGTMSPTQTIRYAIPYRSETYNDNHAVTLCPITSHPCEGDLSYLCEDYGCARKGGLSPHSEENF